MKRISELLVLTTLLVMAACGGSSAADETRPNNKDDEVQKAAGIPAAREGTVAANSTVGPADFLRLSEVRLSPADLFANIDLNAEAVVIPPVPEGIEFEYRWFVNNQEVADATGPTLKSGNFRKRQWIFCEARATGGGKVSIWLKSKWVQIANSPPQIEAVAVDNFVVPGQLLYQIKASDVDKDELTYDLIAPLGAGIELDKKSGLLTWNIDDKIVEKLGETIVLSLSVSDNDAAPSTYSLSLVFQKKKAVKNQ